MRKYVYTLRSKKLKEVVENYINYVSNPCNLWRQKHDVDMFTGEEIYNDGEGVKAMPLRAKRYPYDKEITNLPKPRYMTAKAQVMAIVDILYRYSHNVNEDSHGWFTVSSRLLKKASNNYTYIIDALYRMKIINKSHDYTDQGRYARRSFYIYDDNMFHLQRTDTIDKTAQKLIQATDTEESETHRKNLADAVKTTSSKFVTRYNNNLSKLTINKSKAIEYIKNHYNSEEDRDRKKSRLNTVYKIANGDYKKEIRSIDSNGRIYHIGTELQRDLKEFTNINYTIDCKNSHPFLFSYIILRYITHDDIKITESYNDISFHFILRNIFSYLKDNGGNYNHNMFSDFLSKNLDNNKVSKVKRAKVLQYRDKLEGVKDDVWRYIYDVSEGKLWDMFRDAFNEDRTTVKQKVFASVMYSYYSERPKKKEENAKWIEMFAHLYPTVFKVINDIKKSLHQQCRAEGKVVKLEHPITVYIGSYPLIYTDKDEVMLPLMLMRLESKIFTQILTKLFNKRICCFGIHDAVAVIHSKLSIDEIKDIMMNVYAEYGLMPTLSVDYYS